MRRLLGNNGTAAATGHLLVVAQIRTRLHRHIPHVLIHSLIRAIAEGCSRPWRGASCAAGWPAAPWPRASTLAFLRLHWQYLARTKNLLSLTLLVINFCCLVALRQRTPRGIDLAGRRSPTSRPTRLCPCRSMEGGKSWTAPISCAPSRWTRPAAFGRSLSPRPTCRASCAYKRYPAYLLAAQQEHLFFLSSVDCALLSSVRVVEGGWCS